MSTRSRASALSTASDQSGAELEDVYQYSLRVAYLAYLMSARATAESAGAAAPPDTPKASGRMHLRQPENWAGALFSIGDIFKDGKDSRSVRFPKELVRVLQQRIEAIARGADPKYSDMLLRSTFGVFYGTYTQDSFLKQMKENRKIEELILLFVTTATTLLRKRLEGDEWKAQLNFQVGQFVQIIRECLRSPGVKNVSPELNARLDTYSAKLSPPAAAHRDPGDTAPPPSSAAVSPWMISHSIQDMPMVRTVGYLFGVADAQLQKEINSIKRFCNEKAAIEDLKACIANVSQNARFPGRREDFPSDEAYHSWRTSELSVLQQLMLSMIKSNPELVQSSPDDFVLVGGSRDGPQSKSPSAGNRSSIASGLGVGLSASTGDSIIDALGDQVESLSGHAFTYIPPSPRAFFGRLTERCLDYDLEAMKSLAEDEEVSLRILSQAHLELLSECAIRWRIMQPYRVTSFLDGICRRFAEEEIPIVDCVVEAFGEVAKTEKEWAWDRWPRKDAKHLTTVVSSIFDTLFRRVYEGVHITMDSKPADDLPGILETLYIVSESAGFQDIDDIDSRFDELREAVSQLYDQYYQMKSTELFSADRANDVVPFVILIDWIKLTLNRLNKRFTQPILGILDLISLYMAKVAPALVQDLEAMKAVLLPPPPEAGDEASHVHDRDIMDLYTAVLDLKKRHDTCCPENPLEIHVNSWFGSYIESWLDNAEAKTAEWVRSAIQADKFEPEGNDLHSSSIADLMDSCRSAIDFVQRLQWPDEYANAKFKTRLARMVSKSIEQYSSTIEDLFVAEMFPRAKTDADREANRGAIWTRARLAVQGEKKPEAFQFSDSSCVKLNNIESARVLVDQMYTSLDADTTARIIHEYEPNGPPEGALKDRYLFTVKIVSADGLAGADGSTSKIDPFLTLSDERGNRVAKTRTLYESASPRWNESFDISVHGSLWLAATVWKRNLVDQHDMLGRAFLHLDPRLFNDFLAHDLLLNLDTHGRVLIRVSMEGEKDDIQFYFGRAFRSLKRAETDMVRMIVDKISPIVRHYLSHSTIRKLIPSQGFMRNIDIDMTKVRNIDMSRVKNYGAGLWRQVGGGSEPEIPLPKEELPPEPSPAEAPRQKGPRELADADIEGAISDLFDFFDQCMAVLRHSLSESAWQLVMAKIWKEILTIVDGLLLPPLSDQPAEMRSLSDKEVDVVFRWLKFLTTFFHANGEGVPIEDLHNQKYKEIWSVRLFYDMKTDDLMMECVRAMQQQLKRAPSRAMARNKSVYQQRNLGTIRKRKADKKDNQESANSEMIMRILRMRPGTEDFLRSQLVTLQSVQAQQAKQANRPSGIARRAPSESVSGLRSRLSKSYQ